MQHQYLVHRFRILTTPFVRYDVYECYDNHHVTMHFDNDIATWGDVETRAIPSYMEKLPFGNFRAKVVYEFYQNNIEEATKVILEVFPHLVNNKHFNRSFNDTFVEEYVTEDSAIDSFAKYDEVTVVTIDLE